MSCLQLLDSYYLLIHVGSSISRLGGLLERSDRLGSVVYDWVEVGLPSGIDAGTLLRMKRRFRISTLPCLVLIWYCQCGPMCVTIPYVFHNFVLGCCIATFDPTFRSGRLWAVLL